MDCESSTVIVPPLPTPVFSSMMSAMSLPISASCAEMVATCSISSLVPIFFASASRVATTAAVASSIPRFKSMGFAPAATFFIPSRTMTCVRRAAVVVPSPAVSFVFSAASFTRDAPTFSNLSSRSMSFAMVTPSLVTVGLPKPLSSTTFRPLGPRVTRTVFATWSTPASSFRRARSSKRICLGIGGGDKFLMSNF